MKPRQVGFAELFFNRQQTAVSSNYQCGQIMLGMQARATSTEGTMDGRMEIAAPSPAVYRLPKTNWSKSVRLMMSIMRVASIILFAYWALIFFGTHLPKASMPSLNASDKVYHCGAFAGLSFLLCWAIPSSRFSLSKILVLAASVALVYAVLDEWTQQFIPGRTCDIWDVAADSVGVVLGLTSYCIARHIVRNNKLAQRFLAPIVGRA